MSDPTDPSGPATPKQQAIVEVTDDTGRVVDRTSFESGDEAEVYASTERAKGHKATVSSLDPKPKPTT